MALVGHRTESVYKRYAISDMQMLLPLVERIAVRESGWLSVTAFGSVVALRLSHARVPF